MVDCKREPYPKRRFRYDEKLDAFELTVFQKEIGPGRLRSAYLQGYISRVAVYGFVGDLIEYEYWQLEEELRIFLGMRGMRACGNSRKPS